MGGDSIGRDNHDSVEIPLEILDMSPALVWITDAHSRCTYLSRQWYAFTGRTPQQDLGFGWLENIHPEDRARTREVYANAVENLGELRVDYRLRHHSGDYRWSVDVGLPRFDGDGRFMGYIGTVTDIHDRVLAEKALEQTQERFARAAKATDLGVWYCDLPFDELIWTKEVKQHFFFAPDERVTFQKFLDGIHPEDREPTRMAIDYSIANHAPYDIVYRTVNANDPREMRSIRAIGWTDYDEKGTPIRFDGITLDVTRQRRAQEELNEAKIAAETANAAKSSFLANMSHEIRTPLGAILGFTDLMRDANLSISEREQFLDTIARNGRALTRIIDDILDLAKVESGRLDIETIEFSFYDLVQEVLDLFRERARAKGIYLVLSMKEGVPARILSDPTRLRQIFINLIGNAVKFTREGGVTVFVGAVPNADGKLDFEVCIRDTGVGIAPEQKAKLFQPFSQADNSTTRKFGGTGLGLALSIRLARALGGDISIRDCDPAEGQGSTFVFEFEAAASRQSRGLGGVAKRGEVLRRDLALSGVKVLVADDSSDNRFLVERILSSHGAEVETASTGLEAFKLGIKGDHDIVLMDIQMPLLDGYDATRTMREAGYTKPIIALTAHAMAEERARTRAAGCDGHLTKPIQQKELIETISRHVKVSRAAERAH